MDSYRHRLEADIQLKCAVHFDRRIDFICERIHQEAGWENNHQQYRNDWAEFLKLTTYIWNALKDLFLRVSILYPYP